MSLRDIRAIFAPQHLTPGPEVWHNAGMSYYTKPVPYRGTAAERAANQATHLMVADEDGGRCLHCDAREASYAADYPCGTEVPTLTVSISNAENPWIDGGLSLGGL